MSNTKRFKYLLLLSDIAIVGISLSLSFLFVSTSGNVPYESKYSLFPFLLIGAVSLFAFEGNHLYAPGILSRKSAHINAVLKAVLLISLGLLSVSFFVGNGNIVFITLLISTFIITSFLLLYLYRVKIIAPKYNSKVELRKNILIVGEAENSGKLSNEGLNCNNGFNVAGFICGTTNKNYSAKYIGNLTNLSVLIKKKQIDEVVIHYDGTEYEELLNLIEQCSDKGVQVKVISPLFNVVAQRVKKEMYGNLPVVSLSSRNPLYVKLRIKRGIDIAGALLGIIILSPFILVIGAIIKATSPGPVFFKQMRVGRNGKLFEFYKFRSMYNSGNEDEERACKMREFVKKDKIDTEDAKVVDLSRVTKIGRIIRKTSIDELPQLLNVLKGDMSLVGPRPDVPYVFDIYEHWHKERVKTIPGCTGVWQVEGRSMVTFNEMTIMDIYYIHNISFFLDLKMIIMTLPVMFLAKGGK